jgi:hypothetical protein
VLIRGVEAPSPGFVIVRYGHPAVATDFDPAVLIIRRDHVIVGMPDGEIRELDPAARTQTIVYPRPAAPIAVSSLGEAGGWRSARWANGRVWRRGPGGRDEVGELAPGERVGPVLIQSPAGRVCVNAENRIECWNPDGARTIAARMEHAIMHAEPITDDLVMLKLADNGIYTLDLASGEVRSAAALGEVRSSLAAEAGLAVINRSRRSVSVIDLLARTSWPLMTGHQTGAAYAVITSDGELAALTISNAELLIWKIGLPDGPWATAAWVDSLTNATAEQGPTKLGWR